jgi:septum site-determining protein MinD
MGEVIVITSGKGGVGKTTTSANLGAALANIGKSVLLLDADIGLRNLDVVMGLENRIVYDLVDVIEGKCRLRQAIIRDKRCETLYILAASQTKDKEDITIDQMKKLCSELKENYDYILIDCPAGIEQGFENAISAADTAIVVVTPEVSSVRDADKVLGLVEAREIKNRHVLINRIRPELVRRGNMLSIEDVIEILAVDLIGAVPDDVDIIVSTNKGEPAAINPRSRVGQAFRNTARRIAGESVPLMDLFDNGSIKYKIKKMLKKNKNIGGSLGARLG